MMGIINENTWKVFVLLLKHIAEKKGISQNDIAGKTGFAQSHIARMFSLKFSPSLKNFLAIAQSIGVNFFVEDKESDTDLSQAFEKAMTELGLRPNKLPKN